jgi:hypothetical protein
MIFQLLRYGGSWGIQSGRRGNAEILSFWEKSGCLISDSQSAASKCSDSGRVMHEARMNGLATLLQSIRSSVEQVNVDFFLIFLKQFAAIVADSSSYTTHPRNVHSK